MARDLYVEARNPHKLPLSQQLGYYRPLAEFWVSVANKYPNKYNRHKAKQYLRNLKRVLQEIVNNDGLCSL